MKNYLFNKLLNINKKIEKKITSLSKDDLSFYNHIYINRTNRKKTISIRVDKNKVTVNTPHTVSDNYIINLLRKKKRWIEKNLENKKDYKEEKINTLQNGESIYYLGSKYLIEIKKGLNSKVYISKNKLYLTYQHNNNKLKAILEEWYKNKFYILIQEKLVFFSQKIGVKYKSFNIKFYKRRLGSCSNSHILSFNWKLVMMPEKVIDYVIIHELCHIIHFNHSKIFWNRVAVYCPDFKIHKDWIKKNSEILLW